jgi:hypothetical protein
MKTTRQNTIYITPLLSYALLLFSLLFNVSASATLISVDDAFFGADSITRQTNGREWLDHSFSFDCSYENVTNKTGCGSVFEGWRYATRAEILDLWFEAGFSPGPYDYSAEYLAIGDLLWMMDSFQFNIYGLFNDDLDGIEKQFAGIGYLSVLLLPNVDAAQASIYLDKYDISSSGAHVSSWLVRVPEPTFLTLLGLGLALFGYLQRKTRKP